MLHHEQVVQVIDYGNEQGHAWYAMDYIGPCNLGDILLVRKEGVPSALSNIVMGIIEGDLDVVPKNLSASAFRFPPPFPLPFR